MPNHIKKALDSNSTSRAPIEVPSSSENNDFDGFARSAEVRHFLGDISKATLWRWIKKGYFPPPEHLTPNPNGPNFWKRSRLRDYARNISARK